MLAGPGTDVDSFGIPNMIPLIHLAKLRVLEGLRTGDAHPALQEVRHLARLVACQDSLVAAAIAKALLDVEARGHARAIERGMLAADAWTPVPEEVRAAMRRVGFGFAGVYLGLGPDGSVERVEALPDTVFGRCAGLGEAMHLLSIQRAVLGEPWPFEIDHDAAARTLDGVLETTSCRLPMERAYWVHPEWNAGLGEKDFSSLPYVRDLAWYGAPAHADRAVRPLPPHHSRYTVTRSSSATGVKPLRIAVVEATNVSAISRFLCRRT